MRFGHAIAGLLVALACAAPAAQAGDRLDTFTLRSAHVEGEIGVTVMRPVGYDKRERYPVLYLLHGQGETHAHWSAPTRGDVERIADAFGGIVVMPDQRAGFSVDALDGSALWTRFFSEELIPAVEARYPVRRERRFHAIAGVSMGGYGAVLLGSQRPDYFGTVVSMSGLVSIQHTEVALALTAQGIDYEKMFGPVDGPYAAAHNPPRLVENLRHTRLLLLVGDGTPTGSSYEAGTDYPIDRAALLAAGSGLEAAMRGYNTELDDAAAAAGVRAEFPARPGVHDWPDFRRSLGDALAWDVFGASPESPAEWTFRTIRPQGRAWSFSYRFARSLKLPVVFHYADGNLSAAGVGTVTIEGPGCRFVAELPFRRRCPETAPGSPAASGRAQSCRAVRGAARIAVTGREGSCSAARGHVRRYLRSGCQRGWRCRGARRVRLQRGPDVITFVARPR